MFQAIKSNGNAWRCEMAGVVFHGEMGVTASGRAIIHTAAYYADGSSTMDRQVHARGKSTTKTKHWPSR